MRGAASIQRLGRLWLVLRPLFKEALKADHICGGIECIEPGGLRSEYSGAPRSEMQGNAGGPNEQAYALLECLT